MANETGIWSLVRDVETGKRWLYKQPPANAEPHYLSWHYGNVEYVSNDGWKVIVFFDCGEFDYFDSFTSPAGKTLGFDDFSDDLRAYRPTIDVCKIMYAEPGYLGCWLVRGPCSMCGWLVSTSDEYCSYCGLKFQERSTDGQPLDR